MNNPSHVPFAINIRQNNPKLHEYMSTFCFIINQRNVHRLTQIFFPSLFLNTFFVLFLYFHVISILHSCMLCNPIIQISREGEPLAMLFISISAALSSTMCVCFWVWDGTWHLKDIMQHFVQLKISMSLLSELEDLHV